MLKILAALVAGLLLSGYFVVMGVLLANLKIRWRWPRRRPREPAWFA